MSTNQMMLLPLSAMKMLPRESSVSLRGLPMAMLVAST